MHNLRHYTPTELNISKYDNFFYFTKKYGKVIDFDGSLGANVIGHRNAFKKMKKIISFPMINTSYKTNVEEELNYYIKEILEKNNLNNFYLIKTGITGSNLIETFFYNKKVFFAKNDYHGKTPAKIIDFIDIIPENFDKLKNKVLIFETVNGGFGKVEKRNKTFFNNLNILQKEYNTILVADEIQFGFFHTGKLFSFQNYNIKPNYVLCGKAFSFPVPFSFIIGEKEFSSEWTSTYQYYPIGMKSVIENIKFILNKKNIESKVKKINNFLNKKIKINKKNIIGSSFMLVDDTRKIKKEHFLNNNVMMSVYHTTGRIKSHISPLMEMNLIKEGVENICKTIEKC